MIASVLSAAGYDPLVDFVAYDNGAGAVQILWSHADPQPTEQQINDWATDVTPLPSGQLFSEWQAEHGGDPVKTTRKRAKDLVAHDQAIRMVLRAFAAVTQVELQAIKANSPRPSKTLADLEEELTAMIDSGVLDEE